MSLFFDPINHQYTWNNQKVPSVSQILSDMGFINSTFFTEEGRKRGKAVHKAVENHCRGAHCMKDPKIDPYLEAFMKFERDCDWKLDLLEVQMGCPTYAGTPDQIGKLNGNEAVLDTKSGAISAATGLQLSAYEKLYRFWSSQTEPGIPLYVGEFPLPPMKRFALQLFDTGKYMLTEYSNRQDKYIWDSSVAIWHWKRNHGMLKY